MTASARGDHKFTWRLRGLAGTAVLGLVATGLAFGFTLVSLRLLPVPEAEVPNGGRTALSLSSSVDLAKAFVAALNAHDVELVVEMFTDEDSGPTVTADRYAWQKFEIRLWAQRQVAANVHADAYGYSATEQGAAWTADVYRADWPALGVQGVRVADAISVHNGKLADFTSTLADPTDQQRLGDLWQPRAVPERPVTTLPPPAGASLQVKEP